MSAAAPKEHPSEPIGRLHFALLAALAVPLVCLSFHPVEEIDSINYLHYLIDWMGNRATPYIFATNYVAFWELSFLPAWTVTGVDAFFPLLALKSLALLALAAWLVGRELGLRGPLLLWTVATSLTLRHLWFESSGVGTLKNDALHGAGFLLLMLARAARGPVALGACLRGRLRGGQVHRRLPGRPGGGRPGSFRPPQTPRLALAACRIASVPDFQRPLLPAQPDPARQPVLPLPD